MLQRHANLTVFRGCLLAACLGLIAGCGAGKNVAPDETPASAAGPVATAPPVPTGLKAMPGNAQASLVWSASSGAESYAVKRSTSNSGPYAQISSATSPSYTDTAVSNGTTYFYVVKAVNSAGDSPDSAPASVTPDPTITTPAVPTGLAATAGNAQASLKWTASSGATSYHVKRATTSGGPYTQVGAPTSGTYTDSGLTNGTSYYYVVSALDSAGESANSAQVSALPAAPAAPVSIPAAPGGLSAASGSTLVTVTWSASGGATGYHVKRATTSGGPYTQVGAPTSTTYTDSSLSNGTAYYYVVSALNSTGESANSAQVSATPTAPTSPGTVPALVPGVWQNITPPGTGIASTFGAATLEVSPVDPNVIYLPIDTLGLWKSTDRGSSWTLLGVPGSYKSGSLTTSYLDSPIRVIVDPGDANHVIATQGVRGQSLGFWVSHDAGNTWAMPQGFSTVAKTTTNDVTTIAVDPTDFNHILLGSHSPWANSGSAATQGIMETKDGGNTWRLVPGPGSGFPANSIALNFLFDVHSGQGNSNTWLVGTDGNGFWRTADAGATWTEVSTASIPHGGAQIYYASNGTLYSGAAQYPIRSKDNGVTWTQVQGGLSYFYYYAVYGDGTNLYTQLSYTGNNAGQGPQPYMTSLESSGATWTAYQGGAQTFNDGPFMMQYDAVNGIMYSANWTSGLWALKVIKP